MDKENKSPAPFVKNISHIPTLKERVAAMASKVAVQRTAQAQQPAPKKPKFDLKESLKRPLGYKPYSGPVKKEI